MASRPGFLEWLLGTATIQIGPQIAPEWTLQAAGNRRIYSGQFVQFREGQLIRQFQGRIVEWDNLPTEVYIEDPPPELRRHRHGSCWQLAEANSAWFRLHWERPARDFDSARAYVEQLIDEAF